jgi:hypothetical protein
MEAYILIAILAIHFICAALLLVKPSSRFRQRKEYWAPILLVPIFGPLMAWTIELLFKVSKPGTKPIELESLKIGNDIFWSKFVQTQEPEDVIPLEEAILLDDIKVRRKAVLSTFREDSFRYLDILLLARHNEDVDTTHYATIQISKIQRQFQLNLQKYSRACQESPTDGALLDEYIALLEKYIESALPEQNILKHQREVFAGLLNKKLALDPLDKATHIRKLRNCINLKEDYEQALEIIGLLKQYWPEDEQVWIEALRACIEWKDQQRCLETIQEIQRTRIKWTRRGRQQVQPWVQVI